MKFLLCLAVLLGSTTANALWPIFYTDLQLAQSPVVVIGYWPNAPIHEATAQKDQTTTTLVITQVLYGKAQVGKTQIVAPFATYWKDVFITVSNQFPPEVYDCSKPNIWFLRHEEVAGVRSQRSLEAYTYRSIQDLKYLPLYKALRSRNREKAVTPLLESSDPQIAKRASAFVARCLVVRILRAWAANLFPE
jgi:hypothetical protein